MDEEGAIKREDFVEFAKKSSAVKELGLRSSRSSTPVEKAVIDKAEVVFKVNLFLLRPLNKAYYNKGNPYI